MEFEKLIPIVIIAFFVTITIIILLVNRYTSKRRTNKLKQFAMERGFEFKEKVEITEILRKFSILNWGHSYGIKNHMTKKHNDGKISIFDFRYTTGYGKESQTLEQTAIIINLEKELHNFLMEPKKVITKKINFFKKQDIDFENNKVFSDNYRLTSKNPDAVRSLFNQEIMHFFENDKTYTIKSGEKCLMIFRKTKKVKPQMIQQFFEKGIKISKHFKR